MAEPLSDNFDNASIDAQWTSVDAVASEAAGVLSIAVPVGGTFDIWGSDTGKKVLENCPDTDFVLTAKISNPPATARNAHIAGILVKNNAGGYVRCDVFSTGTEFHIFLGNAGVEASINQAVTRSAPCYIRLTRASNLWTAGYSQDGSSWTDFTSNKLDATMTITSCGVWAGSTDAAAYTATFDWFETSTDPFGSGPPDAPSSLVATARYQSIGLAWTDNDDNPDETSFRVERAPDAAGSPGAFAEIGTAAANATTYTDSTVSLGSTYHYRVRARNGDGDSSYSNTAHTAPNAFVTWTAADFDDEAMTTPASDGTFTPATIELDDDEGGTITDDYVYDNDVAGVYWLVWTPDDDDLDPTDPVAVTITADDDSTPPSTPTAAISVTGGKLRLTFSEPVTVSTLGFALTVDGNAVTLVSVDATTNGTATPEFWLGSLVRDSASSLSLDYDDGPGNTEDLAGNDLADFDDLSVTNGSTFEPYYEITNAPASAVILAESAEMTLVLTGATLFDGLVTITSSDASAVIKARNSAHGDVEGQGTGALTHEPIGGGTRYYFTVTPSVVGTLTLTFTNDDGWTNPSQVVITAVLASKQNRLRLGLGLGL